MKLIYNNKEVANNTLNYNALLNKPLINSKELVGNTTLNDLNVYNKNQVDNLIASTRSVKAVPALPTPLVENTMYYVGPDSDDNYHVFLVDSSLTLIDLGLAKNEGLYKEGIGINIDTENEVSVKYDIKTLEINSEGNLAVIAADNTTAFMNGHLLDSESNTLNTDIAWYGTQAEYDAITTKSPNTIYFIDDGKDGVSYPLGTVLCVLEDTQNLSGSFPTNSSGCYPILTGTFTKYGPMSDYYDPPVIKITTPPNETWTVEASYNAKMQIAINDGEAFMGTGIGVITTPSIPTRVMPIVQSIYSCRGHSSGSPEYGMVSGSKTVVIPANTTRYFVGTVATGTNTASGAYTLQAAVGGYHYGPAYSMKITLVNKSSD